MTKIHLFLLMLILPLKFAYPDYGYFPLQMDYSRKYLSPHPFMPSSITFTESIVSALMIEGEHYYLFNHYRLGENVFFREWNNCVYVRVESTAHLLYDFSANAGDSWNAPDPPNAFWGVITLISKTDIIQEFDDSPEDRNEHDTMKYRVGKSNLLQTNSQSSSHLKQERKNASHDSPSLF